MIRAHSPILVCLSILCGMLFAGLAPFHHPKNAVAWLPNQNGLDFNRRGIVLSPGAFQTTVSEAEASSSLEIWLQPGLAADSDIFLSFSTTTSPEKFFLQKYRDALIVKRNEPGHPRATVGLDGVFYPKKPVFITLTSGSEQTAVYIDGALASTFPHFRLGTDFTGQLVAGSSAVANDGWHGQIRGLAIYHRELTPQQVRQHFEAWTKQGRPQYLNGDQPVALYLFDEHTGDVVHNAVRPGVDLKIPERYLLPHQRFLEPFWEEYEPGWSHWKDILVNIVGFMPLGLCFYAYWTLVRPIRRAFLFTMVLGFALSLTIEILQSFLPTRNSGTTDLFTNTLGTFLGIKLYGWKIARTVVAKLYQIPVPSDAGVAGKRPATQSR